MTNNFKNFSWSMALLLMAMVALFMWRADPGALQSLAFRDDMALAAPTVIGALLVITLIVERALATVNAILFGASERQAEYDHMQAEQAGDDTSQAEHELKIVMDSKARVRLLLGFAVGLFVSAAGVRTLEGLLDATGRVNQLLFSVDVVLTAGLIAGGSNALAFLAQVLRDMAAPPPEAEAPANAGGGEAAPAAGETRKARAPAAAVPQRKARNLRARLV